MRVVYALVAIAVVGVVPLTLARNSSAGLAQPSHGDPTSRPAPRAAILERVTAAEVVTLPQAQEDNDEPDVLLMALLTVGVAAGAGVLALIGYAIRNRIGFWPHRPPPREGGAPE